MSKYNIVTLNSTKRDPTGELVSTFVFVDLKEKTILTQPFQSEYQARVDYDTKGNKIRVFGSVNSFGWSVASGGKDNPVVFEFDLKDKEAPPNLDLLCL